MSWAVYGTISESHPGYGAIFTVPEKGGFLNAATISLKRITGRIFKTSKVSVFKEASQHFYLPFSPLKGSKKI
jgi:hypothetical protein